MVLDARVRPPFQEFTSLSIFSAAERSGMTASGVREWPKSVLEHSFEALLAELDAAGVTKAVVHGRQAGKLFGSVSNDTVAQIRTVAPDRFWLLGGVGHGSALDMLKEARRCQSFLALDGIVLDPGWLDAPRRADDAVFYPVYAYCEENASPVFVTLGIFSGPDLSYSDPAAIQRVAADFPDLRIVVTHASWPWTRHIAGVMLRHRNVWVIPDFYMNVPLMPGQNDYVEIANSFLGGRMLFASAYPGCPVGEAIESFKSLPIDAHAAEAILNANLLDLFGSPDTMVR